MAQKVYPQDYSCIIDPKDGAGGLYIGNLQAAQNLPNLKRLQVKSILSAAKGVDLGYSRTDIPYFLYIPVNDHESCDIGKFFHQAANFIHDCLQRTNLMVHCLAGVSRSVSLVLSYLIKHKGHSFQSAFDMVKSRRRIIHPNEGFIQQLKKFEREVSSPYEHKSLSSSPSKRNMYRDNSLSSSPSKKYTPNRQIEAIIEKYQNYRGKNAGSIKKNPQNYLELRKAESHPQPSVTDSSQFRSKRIASMTIDRNDLHESKYDYGGGYIRKNYDYGNPLESIQNRQTQRQTDIDKKIEEIRKKYQQYQTPSTSLSNMSSYNRFSSTNLDENKGTSTRPSSFGIESSYINYGRQSLCGDIKNTRLKRLTSFQDY